MEQSLTPVQKVWRSFAAGRPPQMESDPLQILQRSLELLRRLKSGLSTVGADVTSAGLVFTTPDMPPDHPTNTILLSEAQPHEALAILVGIGSKHPVRVIGMIFGVKDASGKQSFAYPFDRTQDGLDKLGWTWKNQSSGSVKNSIN